MRTPLGSPGGPSPQAKLGLPDRRRPVAGGAGDGSLEQRSADDTATAVTAIGERRITASVSFTFSVVKNSMTSPGLMSL